MLKIAVMYNVCRKIHDVYGNVILVSIEETGEFKSPFKAAEQVKSLRRLWLEDGSVRVKILINNQILTVKELDKWSANEYNFLPKCHYCVTILNNEVFTHQLCGNNLFCSQECANRDYSLKIEEMNSEEEIDYL